MLKKEGKNKMNNENKKNNKKVLKRVMFAMGATALLTGGIVTSTALNSYKAPQIPEANYTSMQNVDPIDLGSTKVSTTKLANTDVSTQANMDSSKKLISEANMPSFSENGGSSTKKKTGKINDIPTLIDFNNHKPNFSNMANYYTGDGLGLNSFVDWYTDEEFYMSYLEDNIRSIFNPEGYENKKTPLSVEQLAQDDLLNYTFIFRFDYVAGDYTNHFVMYMDFKSGKSSDGKTINVIDNFNLYDDYLMVLNYSNGVMTSNCSNNILNLTRTVSYAERDKLLNYYIDANSLAIFAYKKDTYNYSSLKSKAYAFTNNIDKVPSTEYKINYISPRNNPYEAYYEKSELQQTFTSSDDYQLSYNEMIRFITKLFSDDNKSNGYKDWAIFSTANTYCIDRVRPYMNFALFQQKYGGLMEDYEDGTDVDIVLNSNKAFNKSEVESLISYFDDSDNFTLTTTFNHVYDDDEGDEVEEDWYGKELVSGESYTLYAKVQDGAGNTSHQYVYFTATDVDYPTISSGDIVVNVDNPLTLDQIKSCFKANDPTEGDLTDNIKFSNITYVLDSNGKIAVGEYSITASVSDTAGNSATVTKKIHVVDITSPIVAGTNFSTGNITKLTDAEILKHLTYNDNYYSKDNITITLSYDDYKNNYTKPGKYQVGVSAKDPSGNVGTTTLTITVTDTTKPVITATNKTTGNSTCLSQSELLALFSATDDVTASPTITIVTDNYTANYRKPGSYTVIAKATDEAGNSSQATATITVTDTTAPTISAINAVVSQTYTTKLTEAELKALFKVSDDVTATDKIVVTIVTDNYTAKYNTPGSYTVTAKAADEAGNTAQATVTIKVIDDIKPVIVLTKEIKTTTQLALTMADIAKYVKATDAIDGNITPQITDKDGYLTKTNKVGTYNFEVTATDKSGNVAKETFVIIVEDKDVPVITVSGYTITAAAGQVYKRSDIIKFLIQTGQLSEEEADAVSVESNYFDSENPEAGNYELTITRADGSVQQMSLLVTESNNDAEKNEGFFGWIKNHLAIVLTALGAVVLAALGFVFLRKKRR